MKRVNIILLEEVRLKEKRRAIVIILNEEPKFLQTQKHFRFKAEQLIKIQP